MKFTIPCNWPYRNAGTGNNYKQNCKSPALRLTSAKTAALNKYKVFGSKKNGYGFNGSKVDRSCSYSKISFQLQQNDRQNKQPQTIRQDHSSGLSSMVESVASGLGGLFDIQPSFGYDENEVEAMKQEAKKKKKKRGRRI